MKSFDVVSVGVVGWEVELLVPAMPDAAGSAPVRGRRGMPGGAGANVAVAAARRGASVALIGVIGQDAAGTDLCLRLAAEEIDIRSLVRRPDMATPLLLSLVDDTSSVRYLEHLPEQAQLTVSDMPGAAAAFAHARVVVISMAGPAAMAVVVARAARDGGAKVIIDGAPDDPRCLAALLALTDVVRADAEDMATLVGYPVRVAAEAVIAARALLMCGPSLAAITLSDGSTVLAWADGTISISAGARQGLVSTEVGAGFIAGLAVALSREIARDQVGRHASRPAAATTVADPGRPAGGSDAVEQVLNLLGIEPGWPEETPRISQPR
ncbi:carbohydrate kinase family protein [Frankia sp. AgPm24]|uniref:carbohydrate kinase family protein n=1 Tax=Frankia sp. AgPm24 TaxID=631128 RepID=UPI00200C0D75|nr:carbohydrate kinase family protein [Frankia sp. AgPm24]MCK9923018.1 carbohydrate kinase family protein [Frankia sp. AgPm24]